MRPGEGAVRGQPVALSDREYARVKRRINRTVAWWKPRLGLGRWQIEIELHRDGLPKNEPNEGGWLAIARVHTEWQHLCAKIDINCPLAAETPDDALEQHLVHELLHVAVREMREIVPDRCGNCGSDRMWADGWLGHEERVVTELATSMVQLKRANRALV